MGTKYMSKDQLEQYKKEIEARLRLDLSNKLTQVNDFLDQTTQARDHIDRLRDNNEQALRRDLEKTRSELSVRNSSLSWTYDLPPYEQEKTWHTYKGILKSNVFF